MGESYIEEMHLQRYIGLCYRSTIFLERNYPRTKQTVDGRSPGQR